MNVHMLTFEFWGFRMEQQKSVHLLVVMSSIIDNATAIFGQESKRANLATLSRWEGWHTFPPVTRAKLTNHGCL